MGITASSMWDKMKSHMASVTAVQSADPADALAQRDQIGIAMCQGIVDEIQQNAVVSTSDAQGGTNTGTVS
jgi:hypothetical protein